jgi:ubiquinone/menaquinone biosynthesis C-methylase UbiE
MSRLLKDDFLDKYRGFCFKICWGIQAIITPSLKYSQYLYEDILKLYVNPNVKWLDLGCGHQLLPSWRLAEEKNLIGYSKMIVGIDYDLYSLKNHKNISLKIRGDITELPFRGNSFHLVTANMVIEHLENPNIQFQEIKRILKPGGVLIFHTPNILGYTTMIARCLPRRLKNRLLYLFQGRKEEDIFNTYYRLNGRKSIINLAEANSFKVLKIKMIVSSPQLVIIPPLVIFELLWIRILMGKVFKPLRTNIIAILKNDNKK